MPEKTQSHESGGADAAAGVPATPVFWLGTAAGGMHAGGMRTRLTPGPAASLGTRVAAFFAARRDGPALLVGAIPFDRAAPDHIFQPCAVANDAAPPLSIPAARPSQWRVRSEPPVESYARAVADALAIMTAERDADGGLTKVVLARTLELEADVPVDAAALLPRLTADPAVTAFMLPLPASGGAAAALVGATPELLISRRGGGIVSNPLAGSMTRSADPRLDREAAETLARSDKDRREHALVVEAILDVLTGYCTQVGAPAGIEVQSTATMWHLGTRITGTLKDGDVSAAELAAALHPTPAVGGMPRERAAQAIRTLEMHDRGFYAGAIGWVDGRGDGEWYVTLRCAEVAGRRVRLHAGAGIVPGSDPAAEVRETSAKFQAMLRALGIDEAGRALAGAAQ